jgi:hypothetical protein
VLKVFWAADDGNLPGSRRFFAQVGVVLVVPAVFASYSVEADTREFGVVVATPGIDDEGAACIRSR